MAQGLGKAALRLSSGAITDFILDFACGMYYAPSRGGGGLQFLINC